MIIVIGINLLKMKLKIPVVAFSTVMVDLYSVIAAGATSVLLFSTPLADFFPRYPLLVTFPTFYLL